MSIIAAARELEAAVAELGDPPPRGEAVWEESAVMYVRFLAAVFVTEDRHLHEDEYAALAAYHQDGANYHEEAELSRAFAASYPITERAPTFLLAAWERNPEIARRIRDAIHRLVFALINADRDPADAERAAARAYLNLEGLLGGPYSDLP